MQAPFFRALDALAVDDGGGGARFARGSPATAQVKRVVDTIERTVPAPQIEIIVDCRARWQVLGNHHHWQPVLRTYIRPLTTPSACCRRAWPAE